MTETDIIIDETNVTWDFDNPGGLPELRAKLRYYLDDHHLFFHFLTHLIEESNHRERHDELFNVQTAIIYSIIAELFDDLMHVKAVRDTFIRTISYAAIGYRIHENKKG